jgi:anti-anti-sigma factor
VLDDLRVFRAACRLSGEVDAAVTRAAGLALLATAIRTPGPSISFDCAELTFIDASGITMFLRVEAESGKRVHLVNLSRSCRRVFEVLDLCERFGIGDSAPRDDRDRLAIPA